MRMHLLNSRHKFAQNFIHTLLITESLLKEEQGGAYFRAAGFLCDYPFFHGLLAVIEVPAFCDETYGFMLGEVHDGECFGALGIAAFYHEVEVYFLECLAEYGGDAAGGCSATIGAFAIPVLGSPSHDADFAKEFTTCVALIGVENNLNADGAVERFMPAAYKSFGIVACCVHFCCPYVINYKQLNSFAKNKRITGSWHFLHF